MKIEKNKRCILYCRVSSKEQEDKGYSLEAQEKLLKGYAERNDLIISKIFKISESASGKMIRKTFNEMLTYVKKRKVNIVLCEKIDRLTRNLKDGAVISDWVLGDDERQVHFVKENFVVSKNTRAHENLVWDMKVAIARFYTNNLSEEVKKGQIAKLESGWFPTKPKLGYKTIGEKGHKIHVIDEEKAPFIKKAFELYNSGNYTINRLVKTLQQDGFKYHTGKPIGKTTVHHILSEPLYYGTMIWGEKEYQGKHEAIVSEELFNEVQEKLKRKYKAGQIKKHFHLFKGLITCSECGCLITWETQKKHNYGRCKNFKPCSRKGYIREEKIEEKLFEMFDKIKPKSEAVLAWIKKALKEDHKSKKEYSNNTKESLNKTLSLMESRIDKIYEDKIDGVISLEFYNKKFKEYSDQKKEVIKQLSKIGNSLDNYYETGIKIHELAFNAKKLYQKGNMTNDDKRTLIQDIFKNMRLNSDDTLDIKYNPAFAFLSEWMPKLNATSELLKITEYYNKTGSLKPACSLLLGDKDSNPD